MTLWELLGVIAGVAAISAAPAHTENGGVEKEGGNTQKDLMKRS
jgi:hypothetical protein